ncbi:hypothetical protein [Ancylobacter rudongensis]|uniref:Thioesterase domain-containing protein n=1 Tax=Ancylobacter rudongensis TaxID=177413 RepID=A0A1G4SQV2_9HYPH|nr:hypothetical protein [Ancylobacter rudongensis]SCW71488.1 hypothetical protein SAMN05660859_2417 [Ancylobacter rudongensis]
MRFSRVLAVCLAVSAMVFVGFAPAQAQSKPNPNQPRVYLLRGLANIFSLGMDDLAAKLRARGIEASVHSYVDLETLTRYAVEQASMGKRRPSPVIIIGHSLGADAAVTMGNRVTAAGVPVPLVVTFDPVTAMTASSKIGKVVNYYQAGGSGKPVSGARVENIDLTGSGALSHFNIDKAAELHNKVIGMIQRPARQTRPRAVAATPTPKPASAPADAAAVPAATPAVTPAGAAPATPPATTPASVPAAPAPAAATQSGALAPVAGTETASAPSAVPTAPAGIGTSN